MADTTNKIVTVVELDTTQAEQELVKLNSTASNTTKTLEERIEAKNKAVEIQNQLAAKAIKTQEDNVKSLAGVIGKEKDYEKAIIKLSSEKLKALKQSEQSISQLDKLNAANDKVIAKNTAQENSVKSLKTQLREATLEQARLAQQFGETSTESIRAAQGVAELRDQIAFNRDLIAGFDPDQKFKALGAATEIAGTGIQGVTAGMALFGEAGEDAEKVLLKVQAAMSFSQSLQQLSNLGDQFKIFKTTIVAAYLSIVTARAADTAAVQAGIVVENQSIASKIKGTIVTGVQTAVVNVATAAQWLWNAAVMANPIVALVVAIAAAAAGIYFFTKMLMDSSEANEQATIETEKLAKELDKESMSLARAGIATRQKNEHTLAMAKANGQSSKSIRELELKLIDEQVATDLASASTAANTLNQERNNLAKLKAAGVSSKEIEAREKEVSAAADTFKRENEQLDKSYKQRAQLKKDHEVQIAAENTEARKKALDNQKKAQKEREDERKQAEKEAFDVRKREAKAQIDLLEQGIDKQKKKDPASETFEQEKDLLKKKMDYELMTTNLLESEKSVIKQKYSQMEVDLATKKAADIKAIELTAIQNKLKLNELEIIQMQAHGENTLSLELELLEKRKNLELENGKKTFEEKAIIEAQYKAQKEAIEQEDKARKAEEQIAIHEQELEAAKLKGEETYGLEKQLREEARALELSDASLTSEAKIAINKSYDNANTKARQTAIDQDLAAAGEAFGIAKELKIAEMIMNAPTAVANSFVTASKVYPAPLSLAMGAVGAAGVIIPIVKGLADIKKTRFPKSKKGGGASSSSANASSAGGAATSVSTSAVSSLANNNAARLGVDPSIGANANSIAANKITGSSSSSVVFSEGKYKDFQNQVQFKEGKTTF